LGQWRESSEHLGAEAIYETATVYGAGRGACSWTGAGYGAGPGTREGADAGATAGFRLAADERAGAPGLPPADAAVENRRGARGVPPRASRDDERTRQGDGRYPPR